MAAAKEADKGHQANETRNRDEDEEPGTFVAKLVGPALGRNMELDQEQTTPRKLSMDEKEFDNRLCNQVDQLLLTTSESINARNRKIAIDDGTDPNTSKKIKSGQVWNRNSINSNEKNEEYAKTAQKKKKKGRKKNKNQYDPTDNFKLRSRTETPSKEVNICMVASQQISEIEKQALLWKDHDQDDDAGLAKCMILGGSVPREMPRNESDLNVQPNGLKKSSKEAPIPLLARINARTTSPTKLLQKHLHRQQKAELLRT